MYVGVIHQVKDPQAMMARGEGIREPANTTPGVSMPILPGPEPRLRQLPMGGPLGRGPAQIHQRKAGRLERETPTRTSRSTVPPSSLSQRRMRRHRRERPSPPRALHDYPLGSRRPPQPGRRRHSPRLRSRLSVIGRAGDSSANRRAGGKDRVVRAGAAPRDTPGMSAQAIRPWLIRALRAPTVLYDWNLGWLLGRRFLRLTHRGRRSGRCYRMMLEVIGNDRERHEVFVMVGLGRRAQWYRNVIAGGAVELAIGREHFRPDYREVAPAEAAAVLADYERRNRLLAPIVRAVLSRLVGWRYDGSAPARERLVSERPVLAFRPAS
jgi:deazaflavin-dependent oxidoreductase (nitroreductase family)